VVGSQCTDTETGRHQRCPLKIKAEGTISSIKAEERVRRRFSVQDGRSPLPEQIQNSRSHEDCDCEVPVMRIEYLHDRKEKKTKSEKDRVCFNSLPKIAAKQPDKTREKR
jgi:hypothetical protein